MELTTPTVIRELMARHGMRFSKSLGQNFLINPTVCPKMAELGGVDENTNVLEIGPGIGTLTVELAKRARRVVAVELDGHLLPILQETLADYPNVTVVHGDAMKLDLHTLLKEELPGKTVACANLPYYITSPVIMRLLEEKLGLGAITVMVQKEAAHRICAPLPSREAGAITAAVAWHARREILFPVSRGSFLPPPGVDSAVLRLDPYEAPPIPVEDEAALFRIIRAAFSQRRKTLHNTLSSGLGMGKADIGEMMARAGVAPGLRAEQLSLEEFAALANALTAAEAR